MTFNNKAIAGTLVAAALAGGGTAVADNQINPYTDQGDHYELPIGQEHVNISKAEPAVTVSRWNGEQQFTIRRAGLFDTSSRALLSKERTWKGTKEEVVIDPTSIESTSTPDGFNFDINLDRAPTTNVFNFIIDGWQDMNFYYQPALTSKEIAEGAERPENVIGSYAVYSKTKKNHQVGKTDYGTGKIAHIYRPKATDAGGNEVWATLSYEAGLLTVTVPQDFLDVATYPVRVDPTFGYTTVGATKATANNQIFGSKATAPADIGTITDMKIYCSVVSVGGPTEGIVVASSTLTIPTNGVGAGSAGNCNASAAWQTSLFSSSPTLTAGSDYILSTIFSGGNAGVFYDTGSNTGAGINDTTNSYASPTDPTDAVNQARIYSIYATYTAAGGTTPSVTPPLIIFD